MLIKPIPAYHNHFVILQTDDTVVTLLVGLLSNFLYLDKSIILPSHHQPRVYTQIFSTPEFHIGLGWLSGTLGTIFRSKKSKIQLIIVL